MNNKKYNPINKLCILLIALLMISGAMAQPDQTCESCLPEGIIFSTQAQIDSFQINYPNCMEIEGDVTISSLYSINNLNGLSVLTSIGGRLHIEYNDALTILTGLENLTSIGGGLSIGKNFYLTSPTGLEGLTSIGDYLFIWQNNALTSLTGLDNLTSIGDYLSIRQNKALTSLTGLDNLTSIGNYLSIRFNNALTSLKGMEGFTSIGGGLYIRSNNALTSLMGLDNLTSVGGDVKIWYNANLTSLTGLEGLTSIGGVLELYSIADLTSLTGLENLTSIGGYLEIWSNSALTSLTGLENLTSIGGYLSIGSNNALTSLTGIDNIAAGSITNLTIRTNSSLSICEVQSICEYLAAPNGTVYIGNNATGCNSDEEVIAACMVGVEESAVGGRRPCLPAGRSAVNLYPNPASSAITVELPLFISNKNTTLTIYNISGQQIKQHQITEPQTVVDLSGLNAGVYFVRVVSDNGVSVGKVVKR